MTTPEDIITEEGEEISEQNFAQDETDAFDSANVGEEAQPEKPKPEKTKGSKDKAPPLQDDENNMLVLTEIERRKKEKEKKENQYKQADDY